MLKKISLFIVALCFINNVNAVEKQPVPNELILGSIKEVHYKQMNISKTSIIQVDGSVKTDIDEIKLKCFSSSNGHSTCFNYGFGKIFNIEQTISFDLNEKKYKKIMKDFEEELISKGFEKKSNDFKIFKNFDEVYEKEDLIFAFKIENYTVKSLTTTKILQTEKEEIETKLKNSDLTNILTNSLKYIK